MTVEETKVKVSGSFTHLQSPCSKKQEQYVSNKVFVSSSTSTNLTIVAGASVSQCAGHTQEVNLPLASSEAVLQSPFIEPKQVYDCVKVSYNDDCQVSEEVICQVSLLYDVKWSKQAKAGFPISPSKLSPPSTSCVCLGLIIGTVKQTLSVPPEKNQEIRKKIDSVLHGYSKDLQSLIGSFMFLHKGVCPTRFFTNRLLDTLRSMSGSTTTLNIAMK